MIGVETGEVRIGASLLGLADQHITSQHILLTKGGARSIGRMARESRLPNLDGAL